jgi:hypothetical protein
MIALNRERVAELIQKKAGQQHLAEFLGDVEPHLQTIDDAIGRMNAMFDAEPDPILRLPIIGIAADWFRLREDDRDLLFEFAKAALDLAEQHRQIADARIRGRGNRKVDTNHRAMLGRLDKAQKALVGFVSAYPKAMEWIRHGLPTPLPNTRNALGCSVIDTSI